MKNLGLKRILKALEIFSKRQDIDIYNYDGYIMQLLDKDKSLELLHFPTELLLSELFLINKDARLLGDNCILMDDVDTDNMIITKSREIWVSDIDLYFESSKNATDDNLKLVRDLFRDSISEEIKKSDEISDDKRVICISDFRKRVAQLNKMGAGNHIFTEIFENTDKPIEYFKKRLR